MGEHIVASINQGTRRHRSRHGRSVSVVLSVVMIAAGGLSAWRVYRYLGLKLVSRSWFNLDATWAVSLILVGAFSLVFSLDH
ncbi:MAG TPA: hypothetical protein VK281_06850 [Xanthobacteraceae bacterium]|nr:hypothetical protein [Xanthobacteraceae bacterium]